MQAMEARRRISSGDSCGGVVGDITNNEERQPVTHSWAGSVLDIDDTLTRCLAICANSDSKYGFLRPVMKFLELSCHGVPWILGSVLAILIAHQVKTQEKLLNLLMALIVDVMVVMITKLTFRRPRPKHNQMDMLTVMAIDGYSFPSGHATRAATVVCFLLSQFSLWPWTAVILLWAIAVPVSRVFLGRHHVLDIVSGVAIGLLQYRYIIRPLWLSSETCDVLLQPIHEELHI